MATIAALGTGVMGAPMARNLARAGHDVRAWNRSPDKAAPLRDDGVDVRDDPAAAAAGADVVLTMLADADAVLDVARRARPGRGADLVAGLDHRIDGIEQCAALAQETGATLVDAPVLGTAAGRGGQARDPRLRARRGARRVRAAVRRGRAAHHAHRAGGTATRLKLAVNTWVLAVTQGTAETIAIAQALGVDPGLVFDAVEGGALDLPYFRMKAKLMLDEDFPARSRSRWPPRTRGWGRGGRAPRRRPAHAAAIAERFAQANEAGHGDEDMAVTYRLSRAPRVGEPSLEKPPFGVGPRELERSLVGRAGLLDSPEPAQQLAPGRVQVR